LEFVITPRSHHRVGQVLGSPSHVSNSSAQQNHGSNQWCITDQRLRTFIHATARLKGAGMSLASAVNQAFGALMSFE
jgi:hypothetical protein